MSARQQIISTCSAALLAAGCVSYQPRPLDPDVELEALRSVTPSEVVEHTAGASAEVGAFALEDGLNEAEVVAVALCLNPELRAQRTSLGQAEAALISAGVWPNPEVGVGWQGGVAGAPGYTFDANVLFELLRLGERSARRAAADAKIEEVESESLAAELRIAAEARRGLLEVLAAERVLEMLDEERSLREQGVELALSKQKVGEGTELEVSAAGLEAAEVRRDHRRAETDLETARRELNRVLGLPPDYRLHLSDSGTPLTVVLYDDPTDEELDHRLVNGRPELRAKQAVYRQAEEQLRLAVLRQYPSLKIGPSFSVEPEGTDYIGLGASVELPIFDRGEGGIAEAEADRDAARSEYVALLHRLRADAFDARDDMRRARFEVDEQRRDVLPLIERNEELFQSALKAREVSILDWVTARQRSLSARRAYLDTIVLYRQALIRLEAATGMLLSVPAAKPGESTTGESTSNPSEERRP